jgi:tetratricopeptide (TPR) repeat protein
MSAKPASINPFDNAMALGIAHARANRLREASAAFLTATRLAPKSSLAWRALADTRHALGDAKGGGAAHLMAFQLSTSEPQVVNAANALLANRIVEAEQLLRARLKSVPTDIASIRMLGEVALRAGKYRDALRLFDRALELAPGFEPARQSKVMLHYRQDSLIEALAELELLLAANPRHPGFRNLKASILDRTGDYQGAIAIYRDMLDDDPGDVNRWLTLGHALNTTGDVAGGIAAYRRGLEIEPTRGEIYWNLANLKTFRFTGDELDAMRAALARTDLTLDDRFQIEFALGKAMEDASDYAASFAHYAEGNRMRRTSIHHDRGELDDQRTRAARVFTREFLAAHAGTGCPAPDPIFIVGMPRSGSTLVEQILASHPAVEGTMELSDLQRIMRNIGGGGADARKSAYPDALRDLSADQLAALGQDYIDRTRIQRKTDRPFFIDKLPANFLAVGLIRLILPNARVIDVRRHPMSCGFSIFKQHFARGQSYAYDLEELGIFYADYVRMMALWDARMPGFVHRLIYEDLVADLEGETRRMLDFLGLPFDVACLRFHESRRSVRTPSAQQVRQPVYRDATEQWRHYEPWLGPLKAALGEVLTRYPDPPPG